MSSLTAAEPTAQSDSRLPPGLTLNLNSNNPFRNPRTSSPSIGSPAIPSPHSAQAAITPRLNSPRPTATNPFLSQLEQDSQAVPQAQPQVAPKKMEAPTAKNPPADSDAAQLFHRLTLLENSPQKVGASVVTQQPTGHRPSRSGEEERRRGPRMRAHPRRNGPSEELDIFASPERSRESRRARRNSESSIRDRASLNETELKRRQMRARERDAKSRESRASSSSKTRDGDVSKTRRKKPRGMDLIDQLDQTGIYGAGFFHHDGPFDAVNPHRNRKKDPRAPMQAFPLNSANNALGGSGPINKNIDLERFHGVGVEGFQDYGAAGYDNKRPAAERAISFDPTARVEPVHGEETVGLGTSTFLEGAPASRKAIQRRESDTKDTGNMGGLGRKKSLAQRIRGMSRPERPSGALRSPEARYTDEVNGKETSPTSPRGPPHPRMAQSAGGPSRATKVETNPFDNLYDDAYEKKGASIKIAEQSIDGPTSGSRPRAPSSPQGNRLERRATSDSADEPKPGTGFLNRVKSLKGGRRRRES